MATFITMPKLGLTMETGTVAKWLKAEGEPVAEGEPLLELMTEKITTVVESPASGILARIAAPEGSERPIKAVLGVIAAPGEAVPEVEAGTGQEEASRDIPAPAPAQASAEVPPAGPEPPASPVARKMAREHGIDLRLVEGTGPGGRIVREDIERFLERRGQETAGEAGAGPAAAPAPAPVAEGGERTPLTPLRRVIAERMTQSKRMSPHVTLFTEADLTEGARLRAEVSNEAAGVKITYTDLVVRAVALALVRFPGLNSSFTEQGIIFHPEVNVGVAVALEDGLIVPVVRWADTKDLFALSTEIKALTVKAKANALEASEVAGGTFTVSNLGTHGVDFFTPIINQPEAAILGVGRVADRPAVVEGQVTVRKLMGISLSFDHRIVDGAQAAAFLQEVVGLLEHPWTLLIPQAR